MLSFILTCFLKTLSNIICVSCIQQKKKQREFCTIKYVMHDMNKQKIYAQNYEQSQKKTTVKIKTIEIIIKWMQWTEDGGWQEGSEEEIVSE